MAAVSIFDIEEFKRPGPARGRPRGIQAKEKGPRKPEPTLCIYFGTDRLERVRDRADESGESVSAYVSRMCDTEDLGEENWERLRSLAHLKGQSVEKVLAALLSEKSGYA